MDIDYIADQLKVLGHPVRLSIVIGLLNNECSVTKMSEGLNMSQASVSRHLAILRSFDIVEGKRKGTQICYYLKDEKIAKMVKSLLED
ncbi:ArsR/SmtB family transcription factor [Calditerrivibrio nitroreducens]|uniref:Transcriptional regulator, ArsR family n=1 Tax=Calditerrivibrio nitroreducens (strain DSM 19672 / NBRC 101217 / Yu37-1) TaxID=768670 RepID=E4TFV1_CALNY|nr:metalloregulator ArsR/SmtB family transcription factor [Calditerrivibrio nitroreducens]ADR19607.1 transcriptional regulator, ArsR family [Calditerrivibrio nitroreducens DSM 19672]